MWKSVIYLFLPNSWYCESTVSLVPTQNKMLGFAFFLPPPFFIFVGPPIAPMQLLSYPLFTRNIRFLIKERSFLLSSSLGFFKSTVFTIFLPFLISLVPCCSLAPLLLLLFLSLCVEPSIPHWWKKLWFPSIIEFFKNPCIFWY